MPPPSRVTDRKTDRAKARAALTPVVSDDDLADVTDAEIDTALATVDQDALYAAERGKWTTQVWDRTSPINGVPAQHLLDRDDVDENGNDDIVLLLRDGQVVRFQPHEPDLPGLVRIGKGKGKKHGDERADALAADAVESEVVRKVHEHIAGKRGKKPGAR